jgi:PEP-CTERM motif
MDRTLEGSGRCLTLIAALASATAALFVASGADAGAVGIVSYTTVNAPPSGYGGWSYTPTTLNDGLIPAGADDNLLLNLPDNPSITFMLDGTYTLSEIDILNAYTVNDIPGNLVSAVVTIGAQSAVVYNVGFGSITNAYTGFHENESLTLTGLLASTPTDTFTLSGFVTNYPTMYQTALGEVTVQEASITGGGGTGGGASVPEPATWAMMITGFGLIGAAMRRKRVTLRIPRYPDSDSDLKPDGIPI